MANPIDDIFDSAFSGKHKEVDQALANAFQTRVTARLAELFERKHLYQSVQITIADFEPLILGLGKKAFKDDPYYPSPGFGVRSAPKITAAEHSKRLTEQLELWLGKPWSFAEAFQIQRVLKRDQQRAEIAFGVATIRIACAACHNTVQPHNPGYLYYQGQPKPHTFTVESVIAEVHQFPFQCQNCKGEPLIFLVTRKKSRLTLVGRSQFPEISIPDYIPEKLSNFYRSAVIADQTGFTLASALYLRTLIEQNFYQTIPEVNIKAIKRNPTGDELADLYAKTLPKGFPDGFPSLRKAYDDLSVIIHSGKENDEVKKSFPVIRSAVDGHFKAVQLFKEMPI